MTKGVRVVSTGVGLGPLRSLSSACLLLLLLLFFFFSSSTMSRTGLPAAVIDNGTGFTKMGFAGNCEPSWIIPTVIATASDKQALGTASAAKTTGQKKGIADLDFYIGEEAYQYAKTYQLQNPIKHGVIENWTLMEQYWEQCIFKYLRCEPEDHYFLLVRFYFVFSYYLIYHEFVP